MIAGAESRRSPAQLPWTSRITLVATEELYGNRYCLLFDFAFLAGLSRCNYSADVSLGLERIDMRGGTEFSAAC